MEQNCFLGRNTANCEVMAKAEIEDVAEFFNDFIHGFCEAGQIFPAS